MFKSKIPDKKLAEDLRNKVKELNDVAQVLMTRGWSIDYKMEYGSNSLHCVVKKTFVEEI